MRVQLDDKVVFSAPWWSLCALAITSDHSCLLHYFLLLSSNLCSFPRPCLLPCLGQEWPVWCWQPGMATARSSTCWCPTVQTSMSRMTMDTRWAIVFFSVAMFRLCCSSVMDTFFTFTFTFDFRFSNLRWYFLPGFVYCRAVWQRGVCAKTSAAGSRQKYPDQGWQKPCRPSHDFQTPTGTWSTLYCI